MKKRLVSSFLAMVMLCLAGMVLSCEAHAGGSYALIYNGPAASEDAPEAVAAIAAQVGLPVKYIADLSKLPRLLPDAKVFIVGGTEDDLGPLIRPFTPDVRAALDTYLRDGGRYLGICGGGFLASTGWEEGAGFVPMLGIIPAESYSFIEENDEPMIIPVQWLGTKYDMYFQGGPAFGLKDSPEAVQVIARYNNGEIAALISSYGSGKVGVSGPHPEAPDSWREGGREWQNWTAVTHVAVQFLQELLSDHPGPEPAAWKTEVGVVNVGTLTLGGTLMGFDGAGNQVWTQAVNQAANGRLELDVSTAAGANSANIKSIRFDITSGQAVGYQKFYQAGKYRVGLEASPRSNQTSIYVPHIASDTEWWTGIGWNNTTSAAKSLQFAFDTGQQAEKQIGAGGHEAFTIASLFGGTKQPVIGAAQVSNGAGMVGLMLFGGDNVLSGVNLSDATTSTLYFPHVAHNNEWWTGIVVYNPGSQAANLNLTYFDAQGGNLGNYQINVEPGQKMVGDPNTLNFPTGTEWFMVQASQPVTGFELFGTTDSNQLGGYSVVNLAASSGVFPRLERNGWTGIAFVNPGELAVQVQVQARNDAGGTLAARTIDLTPGQKRVAQAAELFPGQDISPATYISFTATGDVVGFQLNGSADGTMLDAIPALGGSHTGTQYLYFPHIAAE